MPALSPLSCLGLEKTSEGKKQLAINDHELDSLRNITLPQGGIFANFCKSDLVSHDANHTCWNGIKVIDVEQDIWSGYCNSSQELASQTECKSAADLNKHTLLQTCCTKPEQKIMTSLKEIADRNWALLREIRERLWAGDKNVTDPVVL